MEVGSTNSSFDRRDLDLDNDLSISDKSVSVEKDDDDVNQLNRKHVRIKAFLGAETIRKLPPYSISVVCITSRSIFIYDIH